MPKDKEEKEIQSDEELEQLKAAKKADMVVE